MDPVQRLSTCYHDFGLLPPDEPDPREEVMVRHHDGIFACIESRIVAEANAGRG